MVDCECLAGCPFFNDNMKDMPATANSLKETYCRTDNSICSRFMVFKALGKPNVPKDLFPNEIEKARDIISKG